MKHFLTLSVFCILFAVSGRSQTKTYFSSGSEMIISFANVQDQGSHESSIMRWTPFFNLQSMANADYNKHFGIFSGIAIRNVGFIYGKYKVYDAARSMNAEVGYTNYKKKFRTYNLAVPIGIKIGNLDKRFVYAGYEVEFPFHYKEKTFDASDHKTKNTEWFSNRVEKLQHGFLVGIQFNDGLSLKFKYYLSSFLNQDYTDSNGNKPYEGIDSHIFYFSLSSALFKNTKLNLPVPDKKL